MKATKVNRLQRSKSMNEDFLPPLMFLDLCVEKREKTCISMNKRGSKRDERRNRKYLCILVIPKK